MSSVKRPSEPEGVRKMVSEGYAKIARNATSCCGPAPSCCGPNQQAGFEEIAKNIGYEDDQLSQLPEGANLGLGCGNPTAIDALKIGEIVVDLGSGAGMDVFLASPAVGPEGRVIGVDMTDEMLAKARENADKGGFSNVEFRKGKIEELPVEDESVDVIISNCVINLSPEKDKVFQEAYRALKPGGRMMISDIVLERDLPREVLDNAEAYVGCVAGAVKRGEYIQVIKDAGFSEIRVDSESCFGDAISDDNPIVQYYSTSTATSNEQIRDYLGAITSLQLFIRK